MAIIFLWKQTVSNLLLRILVPRTRILGAYDYGMEFFIFLIKINRNKKINIKFDKFFLNITLNFKFEVYDEKLVSWRHYIVVLQH